MRQFMGKYRSCNNRRIHSTVQYLIHFLCYIPVVVSLLHSVRFSVLLIAFMAIMITAIAHTSVVRAFFAGVPNTLYGLNRTLGYSRPVVRKTPHK